MNKTGGYIIFDWESEKVSFGFSSESKKWDLYKKMKAAYTQGIPILVKNFRAFLSSNHTVNFIACVGVEDYNWSVDYAEIPYIMTTQLYTDMNPYSIKVGISKTNPNAIKMSMEQLKIVNV